MHTEAGGSCPEAWTQCSDPFNMNINMNINNYNIRRPKGPRRCEILAPLSSLKSRALAIDFDIT